VDVVDIRAAQRVVIEFVTAEGFSFIDIYRCLRSVYGEVGIEVNSVRCWVHHCKGSDKDTGDRSCSSQLAMVVRTQTKHIVDALVWNDSLMITDELCTTIGTEKVAVMTIIRELGYRKVCTILVLKIFTFKHKNSLKKHLCRTSPVQ
jgi:hypothetical protein